MNILIKAIFMLLAIFIIETTSSPSDIYLELNQNIYKPSRIKRFIEVPQAVKDFLQEATSAIQDVPRKIQNIFYPNSESNDERAHEDQSFTSTKERGQWDFFGRDWLKHLGEVVDDFGKKFDSSTTSGLDTNKRFFDGYGSFDFIKKVKAIVPGTRFCGQGDIAGESRELGYFSDTDACCKQHDGCAEYILPGDILYGLENTGFFTRSHCDCDKEFYNCLNNVGGILATKIGFTFFTVLGPQCFKVDYPKKKCGKSSWNRCVKYELDKSQEKRAQWFDNPTYNKI